ncbi:MAG TPA: signal peptidase I [Candidatus Baltobacteraceae bacterium]|nr:signal peptidase I [Candidatus Baltobacteraceae bacterium]
MLGLIGVFAAARLGLSLKPVAAGNSGHAAAIVREYLDAFIVAGLVALFLITFVLRTFYIPSESMVPTLQQHDVLLVNEFAYRFGKPHRGDIVVFKPPIASSDNFIKRVIAVPGDTLAVNNGIVYVNGKALKEPYIAQPPQYNLVIKNYDVYVDSGYGYEPLHRSSANIPPRSLWQTPDRVPNGFYFVMGDNRNDSDDSHIWGFAQMHGRFAAGPLAKTLTTAQFTGRAFLVLWPFDRLRILG